MSKIGVLFLCVFALLGSAFAHNWVKSPFPRSRSANGDSTSKPCEANQAPNIHYVTAGEQKTITWSVNHNGNHAIKLIKGEDEDDLETISGSALLHYKEYDVSVGEGTITIPKSAKGGDWFIAQYSWANYRNCIDYQVIYDPPRGATADESNGNTAEASTVYILPDGNGKFDAATNTYTCDDGSTPTSCGSTSVCSGSCPSSSTEASSAYIGASIVGALVIVAAAVAIANAVKKGKYGIPKGKASNAAAAASTNTGRVAYEYNVESNYVGEPGEPGELESNPLSGGDQLPPNWVTSYDDDGNPYYYNHVTGVSQWEAPRV